MRKIEGALIGRTLPLLIAAAGVLSPGRSGATLFSVDTTYDAATRRTRDGRVTFALRTRRGTVAPPSGPIRATILAGGGGCGTYTFSPDECRFDLAESHLVCNGEPRGHGQIRLVALDVPPAPIPDLSGAWLLVGAGSGGGCADELLVPPFVSTLFVRQCGPTITAVSDDRWFTGTASASGFELRAGSAGLLDCEAGSGAALPRLDGSPAGEDGFSVTQGFRFQPLFGVCACLPSWSGFMSRSVTWQFP
jgi:hypothetical protein